MGGLIHRIAALQSQRDKDKLSTVNSYHYLTILCVICQLPIFRLESVSISVAFVKIIREDLAKSNRLQVIEAVVSPMPGTMRNTNMGKNHGIAAGTQTNKDTHPASQTNALTISQSIGLSMHPLYYIDKDLVKSESATSGLDDCLHEQINNTPDQNTWTCQDILMRFRALMPRR